MKSFHLLFGLSVWPWFSLSFSPSCCFEVGFAAVSSAPRGRFFLRRGRDRATQAAERRPLASFKPWISACGRKQAPVQQEEAATFALLTCFFLYVSDVSVNF